MMTPDELRRLNELVPRLVPIVEPLDLRRCNVYEHTPLDPYRYGEFPRFIRPIGAHQPRSKVVWVKVDDKGAR